MGILNVTPDSFSDGGRYDRLDDALVISDESVRVARMGGPRKDLLRARILHATVLQWRGSYTAAAQELGWGTAGVVASPLPGPAGNVEFFLRLRRDAAPAEEDDVRRAVQEGPQ